MFIPRNNFFGERTNNFSTTLLQNSHSKENLIKLEDLNMSSAAFKPKHSEIDYLPNQKYNKTKNMKNYDEICQSSSSIHNNPPRHNQ